MLDDGLVVPMNEVHQAVPYQNHWQPCGKMEPTEMQNMRILDLRTGGQLESVLLNSFDAIANPSSARLLNPESKIRSHLSGSQPYIYTYD